LLIPPERVVAPGPKDVAEQQQDDVEIMIQAQDVGQNKHSFQKGQGQYLDE